MNARRITTRVTASAFQTDAARLFAYVERFFARHDRTAWPRVERAARALGWTHARVRDAIDGDPDARLYTTAYHMTPRPPYGHHYVEPDAPLPDALQRPGLRIEVVSAPPEQRETARRRIPARRHVPRGTRFVAGADAYARLAASMVTVRPHPNRRGRTGADVVIHEPGTHPHAGELVELDRLPEIAEATAARLRAILASALRLAASVR